MRRPARAPAAMHAREAGPPLAAASSGLRDRWLWLHRRSCHVLHLSVEPEVRRLLPVRPLPELARDGPQRGDCQQPLIGEEADDRDEERAPGEPPLLRLDKLR